MHETNEVRARLQQYLDARVSDLEAGHPVHEHLDTLFEAKREEWRSISRRVISVLPMLTFPANEVCVRLTIRLDVVHGFDVLPIANLDQVFEHRNEEEPEPPAVWVFRKQPRAAPAVPTLRYLLTRWHPPCPPGWEASCAISIDDEGWRNASFWFGST